MLGDTTWRRPLAKAGLVAAALLAVGTFALERRATAQGGAAPVPVSGDPILLGTIDISHQGPDNRPRSITFLDEARLGKLMGMRGAVYKDHQSEGAIKAFIARQEVPDFESFGLLDLNLAFGGMNPHAIVPFAAMTMPGYPPEGYGRVVMLGSDDVPYQRQRSKRDLSDAVYVVRNGVVTPEAKAVMAASLKYNLSLSTGHNSGDETIVIIKEAIALGFKPERIDVTHANLDPPGLTIDQMKQVAALGSYVELAGQSQRVTARQTQAALDAKNDKIADTIKQVGADHVIMMTDLGQPGNEFHPQGLAAFVRAMRARGISPADTDKMTKINTAKWLGIPPPPAAALSTQ
jgi:hypothetical protein